MAFQIFHKFHYEAFTHENLMTHNSIPYCKIYPFHTAKTQAQNKADIKTCAHQNIKI